MNGVLIVDKPENLTSHDVVARCRRILKTKRIGHTGTLDPFATGVMVILVGQATRLAQFLDKDAKEYEATVRFGFATDTGDRTGEQISENCELRFTNYDLQEALNSFRGEIEQTPPMYSAKKIAGKKLYELARKGVEVERKPVKITIYELETIEPQRRRDAEEKENFTTPNLDFENNEDQKPKTENLKIKVVCSAGTYIRVLAEDIGKKLGVGAHLAELRRTRAGKFDLSQAVTLEKLEEIVSANKLDEVLISMNAAVAHLPQIVLTAKEIEKTRNGLKLRFEDKEIEDNKAIRMIDESENLIAIGFYETAQKLVQPRVVIV